MLRQLVQLYAIRAREFSDAVASLGQHEDVGPEFLRLLKDATRRHELCIAAATKLTGYVKQVEGPPSPDD